MFDNGMDAVALRWLAKVARSQYWRVAHWMDFEDLLCDGLLCWQIVLVKYPQATTPPHRMRLFQTIYRNHLHKLANKRSAQVPELACEQLPDDPQCPDAELAQLVAEAPEPLRRCLLLILAHPHLAARPHRRWLNGRRETTNQYLCAIIGIDPTTINLHRQLRGLLGKA